MESIEHYYIDTSVLLENTPHIKFIRNHIRDSGGVFCISSLVKISITSLISCIIETSLDLLRKSLAIFGNLLKFFENIRVAFGQFWRFFGNLRKVVGNLRKIVKTFVISMSI